ncbi:hypothetical protein SPRG_04698 [Saprolegnia parasitica CBS 223.65]|uniref:Uncharacterized protein n=1 Tax=Saprolegnia parasitica (strain CBS 223.65) TaxID=695850 RepID=A0A067CVH6_SAPPC|nr:hypothetical protein SPRG_04698 [Saprolegnia parasitica CBS 223.65]KDO30797.1 hypothetical protein SPRG_04698 [Saprolegnia parasitica CBS 223.65]|eukprot:XP_012198494.1 hypothetical protein SPRG_04698 [Saprolegnia parasitica CBS 223.65]
MDFPSKAHEAFIDRFESAFLQASGDGGEVAPRGSFTASRGRGIKTKQADATFGSRLPTLNRGPPPTLDEGPSRVLRGFTDWVTLAAEIGNSQTWSGLEVAGNWWSHNVGVEYVLSTQLKKNAKELKYRLYKISQVGDLPAPSQHGTLAVENDAAACASKSAL